MLLHSEESCHDHLTELPKGRRFEQKIAEIIIQATQDKHRLAVMIVGLDRFAQVNDTFGHEQGNLLIRQIARRLQNALSEDVFLTRLGGDKFGIIHTSCSDLHEARLSGRFILELFREPFILAEHTVHVTASIGISMYAYIGDDYLSLIKHADTALRRAKEQGRNQYQIFVPQMNVQTYKTFVLQNDLRQAIDHDELTVFYQPRVEPGTHKLVAAEALVRWEHPEWGLVNPREFIAIAEEKGLIARLGEVVLCKVCRQIRSWMDEGYMPLRVSVNLSKLQLLEKDFPRKVHHILQTYKLKPEQLELEITEGAMVHSEQVLTGLNQLKEMGLKFSIDDFGTQYSTFAHLKRYKIDTLKIDQSFVQDSTHDLYSFEIVHSISKLARRLGLNVVAEGVETVEQMELLQAHDCHEYQGYLFSRPMRAEAFVHYLASGYCLPQTQSIKAENRVANRRKHFRIYFPYYLEAYMMIVEMNGKPVDVQESNILVKDMGPGGWKFLSTVHLPVKHDLILQVKSKVLDFKFAAQGRIAWKKEERGGLFSYGLEFKINEEERSRLIRLLKKLQLELKRQAMVPQTSFVAAEEHQYFRS